MPTPGTPYTIGQSTVAGGTSTTTTAVATPNSLGDCIVVFVASTGTGNTVLSVSDPVNGNYTMVTGTQVNVGAGATSWWIMPRSTGVLTTLQSITVTWTSTSNTKNVHIIGVPGVAASPIDVVPTPTHAGAGTPSIASGGQNYSNEVILVGECNDSAHGPPGWTAPMTILGTAQQTSGGVWSTCSYDVVSSTASVTATISITVNSYVADMITLFADVEPADVGGAVDAVAVANVITPPSDVAAAIDSVAPPSVTAPIHDAAGAVDTVQVTTTADNVQFTPSASAATASGEYAVEFLPGTGQVVLPAAAVFIPSSMPRMHLQNILTKQWVHRDVQNITSPLVTWNLNAAGTFSCAISPPRSDLMDATGNPLPQIWQTACYLEQADHILFGGILTQMQPNGPALTLGFTEFNGYANGMPYEGPNISTSSIDALDAVREIWQWLQSFPNSDLGLILDAQQYGLTLGQTAPFSVQSILTQDANPGDTKIFIKVPLPVPGQKQAPAFAKGQRVQVGNGGETHKIKDSDIDNLVLAEQMNSYQPAGSNVGQIQPVTPYTLDWWNSTDCGQEIASIMAEAPFDFREKHFWQDAAKSQVKHKLDFGVPRLGARRTDLRFVEGENIVVPSPGNQDGTSFGNDVTVIGAGSGSLSVRAKVAVVDGRLRRTYVYTDQTIVRPDRAAAKGRRALSAVEPVDKIESITVSNHPNAPFGTFFVGDDIPVQLASGWRNALIWCRITSIQQNPQIPIMTISLARSDSFTYMAQTGSAGTI